MAAIAPTAADAIQSAGGWLFDQALAGWDVTVITAEQADCRPLRILGVRDHTLESVLSYRADGSCLSVIAFSAAMFACDERVRRLVLAAVETGRPELRIWGDADVTGADFSGIGLDGAASTVAHRLSSAARAFKAQALAAAAVCGQSPVDTEVFRRGARRGLGLAAAF
jgi:hypothetical protein